VSLLSRILPLPVEEFPFFPPAENTFGRKAFPSPLPFFGGGKEISSPPPVRVNVLPHEGEELS